MILLFSHVVAFICICNLCEALTGSRKDVLVLDLDGTLYEDDCLIETQARAEGPGPALIAIDCL